MEQKSKVITSVANVIIALIFTPVNVFYISKCYEWLAVTWFHLPILTYWQVFALYLCRTFFIKYKKYEDDSEAIFLYQIAKVITLTGVFGIIYFIKISIGL